MLAVQRRDIQMLEVEVAIISPEILWVLEGWGECFHNPPSPPGPDFLLPLFCPVVDPC